MEKLYEDIKKLKDELPREFNIQNFYHVADDDRYFDYVDEYLYAYLMDTDEVEDCIEERKFYTENKITGVFELDKKVTCIVPKRHTLYDEMISIHEIAHLINYLNHRENDKSIYREIIPFFNEYEYLKQIHPFYAEYYLRMRKKCDIVVASTHNAISYDFEGSLADISPVSNKHYVDLVLGGHEHTRNTFDINGVYFVQSDSHGKSSELSTFSYDFESNSLVGLSERKTLTYNDYLDYSDHPDSTISKMVDDYLVEVEEIGNEVLSTHFNGYYSTVVLSNLMSEAIFEKVKSSGFDVDYSYCNSARESYYGNTFTYRDLYRCFPFDNEIVLMEIDAGAFTSEMEEPFGRLSWLIIISSFTQ